MRRRGGGVGLDVGPAAERPPPDSNATPESSEPWPGSLGRGAVEDEAAARRPALGGEGEREQVEHGACPRPYPGYSISLACSIGSAPAWHRDEEEGGEAS